MPVPPRILEKNVGDLLTQEQVVHNKFNVMSSIGETEVISFYLNCKAALPLRVALEEMGHPHPKLPVIVHNMSAQGIITSTMPPKCSKGYDMHANRLKFREAQKQFDIILDPGRYNRGDYHTKTHSTRDYMNKRKEHVLN